MGTSEEIAKAYRTKGFANALGVGARKGVAAVAQQGVEQFGPALGPGYNLIGGVGNFARGLLGIEPRAAVAAAPARVAPAVQVKAPAVIAAAKPVAPKDPLASLRGITNKQLTQLLGVVSQPQKALGGPDMAGLSLLADINRETQEIEQGAAAGKVGLDVLKAQREKRARILMGIATGQDQSLMGVPDDGN